MRKRVLVIIRDNRSLVREYFTDSGIWTTNPFLASQFNDITYCSDVLERLLSENPYADMQFLFV